MICQWPIWGTENTKVKTQASSWCYELYKLMRDQIKSGIKFFEEKNVSEIEYNVLRFKSQ